jgi:SAM-dependent methyltransferase
MTPGIWSSADLYDRFMGRWSRALAVDVITWMDPPSGLRWLDVGCGTGAVSEVVLERCAPLSLIAVDPSADYAAVTRARLVDARLDVVVAGAEHLPVPDYGVGMVVCGLVLNFVPDPAAAAREMRRVLAPGGEVAVYVWDYSDGMQMLRYFWDAAIVEDAAARDLDEGTRFPVCHPEALEECFIDAGVTGLSVTGREVPTIFRDFDDYWTPFLGGQGPAAAYCRSLPDAAVERLRHRLLSILPVQPDGRIALSARAWVLRGTAD